MARIAVVILNYNGIAYLKQFLPGVIKHSPEAEVIVADNCSSDSSLVYLQEHHPEISLITLSENYGFTGGYNRAIQKIHHEYVVLLNSDIEVTPNWIAPVLDFMDHRNDAVACQPKVKSFHHRSYFEYAGACGGFMDALGYPYCRGRLFDTLEKDHGQYDAKREISWATGATMFIRTEDYKKIGGLDDDFFAHMEEIDMCWRLRLSGKKIYCIPESVVYHVGGGTLSKNNPQKTYLNFRNNLSMLFKNEPFIRLLWKLPVRILLDWLSAIKLWKDNESHDHFFAVLKAHLHFIKQTPKNLKKRKAIYRKHQINALGPVGNLLYAYFIKGVRKFSDF